RPLHDQGRGARRVSPRAHPRRRRQHGIAWRGTAQTRQRDDRRRRPGVEAPAAHGGRVSADADVAPRGGREGVKRMQTIQQISTRFQQLREQLDQVILGQDRVKALAITTLVAGGHMLLEGVPGTGKTLLSLALARLLGCRFRRIQFTPDLMPADLVGANVFNQKSEEFVFRPGPIFTDVLLADEINRTPPRTQAALLEAMQENAATVDGVRYRVSPVFTVFATQNPVEFEGTYPLPEAQRDRFLMKI